MNILFTGVFWGIFLVLIGISILVRVFLNINIPVFRIFFGLFFIALGLNIVFGNRISLSDSKNIVFGEATIKVDESRGKYNVVFSKGITDLTGLPISGENSKIEVNTIFGDNTIYIKKGVSVSIHGNAAFGQIELPDGSNIAFGANHYSSGAIDKNNAYLKLEINTVFGATRVVIKD
ncbi:MAG: cell wall-active antibiotics response protein [Spirochaetia bacterium]|nr:cell wall-active antibiotics response protein [Spirochaetia bacterium]